MTVTELLDLSKDLNQLCAQAEDIVNSVPQNDPSHERLLEHLRKLQSITQELSDCQERR
ncbi:hypothetical protein GCM10011369_33150 [Neiella marina]|uniref:Uncharacterized protein n=1 Tax=Neiella marina TaxID=508461 RepID=A0A8J2XRC0_9GAMM|nr:hypothetical protein [Neiella marina]GGA88374.1 hypothetical protein GCM10011369_33150 [Neiella marina]